MFKLRQATASTLASLLAKQGFAAAPSGQRARTAFPESVGHLTAPETPCRSSRTSGMEVLHARLAEMAVRGVFEHLTQVAGLDMQQALMVTGLQIHIRLFHQRIVPH